MALSGFSRESSAIISLFAAAALAMPLLALAQPTVEGGRIAWPDNGWYQVQDASTYSEVCAGGRFCDVPDGSYNVINHTTGIRYNGILVPAPESGGETVGVDGGRIFWPDNGWYQVLEADTFVELCGGGRFCDVPDGNYIVINHSTGERFEPVVVSLSTPDIPVTVAGNVILWPDDGWYQVQDSTTFESLCGGGSSCAVPNGTYNVINHTTGQRFEGIEVDGDDNPGMSASIINSSNALSIWQDMVGVINEERIDQFFDLLVSDLQFQGKQFFITNTIEDIQFAQGEDLDPPYQYEEVYGSSDFLNVPVRAVYTCARGGQVYIYFNDTVFDDCVAGEASFSGTAGKRNLMRGSITRQPFINFSRTSNDAVSTTVSGVHFFGNLSFVVLNSRQGWRALEFNETTVDGEFELNGYSMERLNSDNFFPLSSSTSFPINGVVTEVYEYSIENRIDGSFNVRAPVFGNERLSVTAGLSFEDQIRVVADNPSMDFPGRDPVKPFAWEAGEIVIVAEDDSSMRIYPAADESPSFMVELNDGEVIGPVPWTGEYEILR